MLRNCFIHNDIRCGVARKSQAEKSAAHTVRPPEQGLLSRVRYSSIRRIELNSMFLVRSFCHAMLFACLNGIGTAPAWSADADILFEKSVRPLFERKCFQCHSSKADELKGNLKLESLETI